MPTTPEHAVRARADDPLRTVRSPRSIAVRLDGVRRVYGAADTAVTALDGVSVAIPTATFTAVMGPSGSGKSTLLQCAAGLDAPSDGSVFIDGTEMTGRTETELTLFRRDRIGFVFQHLNLLPTLTVLENVALPQRLSGRRVNLDSCRAMLERFGMGDHQDRRPAELSGGQQQRVAIARAMAASPAVIFADEPTGALDSRSARDVLRLLRDAVHRLRQTVVMVTHDPVAAAAADSVLFLVDGRLVSRLDDPTVEAVTHRMARLGGEV